MDTLLQSLKKQVKGSVSVDPLVRAQVSHDASIYELVPDVVIEPKDAADIEKLVRFVTKHKAAYPKLAITPRSAGTDMSGGSIGSSILIEMTPHFNSIESLKGGQLRVQPGVYMRDIDPLLAA